MLNLRLLFKNQKKLTLSLVFKWLDISELKMPKLVDLCVISDSYELEQNHPAVLPYQRNETVRSVALTPYSPEIQEWKKWLFQ
jgi:hypothetical protein